MQLFANNASSVLSTGITAAATSLVVSAGTGSRFPSPANGDYFLLTLYQMSGTTEVNHEIVKCTSRTNDTLVIARAQEGTTARAFNAADPVSLRATAGSFDAKAPLASPAFTGTVTTSGSVGVGTAAPARTVHVKVPANSTIGVLQETSGTAVESLIEFKDPNTTADYKVRIGSRADSMAMYAGGLERVRIDTNGGVGINTTSPRNYFEVKAGAGKGLVTLDHNYSFGQENYAMRIIGDIATSPAYLGQFSNVGGFMLSQGARYNGSGNFNPDGTTYSSVIGSNGNIIFQANSGLTAGTLYTPTERLRIDYQGNVGQGVIPSGNWWVSARAHEFGRPGNSVFGNTGDDEMNIAANTINTGSGAYIYGVADTASLYRQLAGQHVWYTAPAGASAGAALTFNEVMRTTQAGDFELSGSENYMNFRSTVGIGNNIRARIRTVGSAAGSGYGGALEISTRNASNVWNTGALYVDYTGNVGVSNQSPTAKLDVGGNTLGAAQAVLTRGGSDANFQTIARNGSGALANTEQASFGMEYVGSTAPGPGMAAGFSFIRGGNAVDGSIAFTTAMTEKMRLTANGSVGIGTTTPAYALDVRGANGGNMTLGRTSNVGVNSEPGNYYVSAPNASGNARIWASMRTVVTTATEGSEASMLTFNSQANGVLAEAMRIDANNNVGIGMATPISKLHVNSGTAIPTYATVGNITNGLMVGVNGAGTGQILAYTTNAITLGAYNSGTPTEWARFTAGNLGLGTAAPAGNLHVNKLGDGASIVISNYQSSAAADAKSGALSFRTAYSGGGTTYEAARIECVTSVNAIDLGSITFNTGRGSAVVSEAGRFDFYGNLLVGRTSRIANGGDVQVSKGISFPATAVALSDPNTLDAYEEGTFTPVINGNTTVGTGTYATNGQVGRYTRVGNRVFISGTVAWTAHTGTGTMVLGGLPFVSNGTANNRPALTLIADGLTYTGTSVVCLLSVGSGTASFYNQSSNAALVALPIDSTGYVGFAGHYEI